MSTEKHILQTEGRIWNITIDEQPDEIYCRFDVTFTGHETFKAHQHFIEWLDEIVMEKFDDAPRPVTSNMPLRHLEELGIGYLFK